MKTNDIRHKFIEFFKARGHTVVAPESTVPVNDKTILFTVAGMTQFKACFTGKEKRPYVRATNSQKCIRVADLNDVGKDGRHLTMFEMLGSWSFGDYYKKEAIAWAYEFVRDELKFDLTRVWISVHQNDQDTFEIWSSMGVPNTRLVRLGDKDNFWTMGPTGPCGPCTEMYFDQGVHIGSCYEAGLTCKGPGCECDRFLEFWNLVFIQFERDATGQLHELPMKSVDTGMGLERLAALLQDKTNVFEIDTFLEIRKHILHVAQNFKNLSELTPEERECTNVIADHVRFLCFTIADGVNFSNEGRGYVLRRVLRRAVRYVQKLCPDWNKSHSFLAKIVHVVVEQFGNFFTELKQQQNRIEDLIFHEEIKFLQTLESGMHKFYEFLNEAKSKNKHVLPGISVFTLHDTFGFPADLTRILCEENHFAIDIQGYEDLMSVQKEKGRAEAKFYKFTEDTSPWIVFHADEPNEDSFFDGYFLQPNLNKDHINYFQKNILYENIKKIRQLKNNTLELVIKHTPFYPEGGGQISDIGFFEIRNGDDKFKFDVIHVYKNPNYISHILIHEDFLDENIKLTSEDFKQLINRDSHISCMVNLGFRLDVARHHTATHLLHKALQIVLGENVRQSGSLVKNDLLRFDFSHHSALTKKEMVAIENIVNSEILKNSIVYTHKDVPLLEAKNMGALSMFNEKYEYKVRVLQIENFSLELCGGTHVNHTGDIGQFKILSENGITSGVRRIEAVCGLYALDYARNMEETLETSAIELKCAKNDLVSKIIQIKEETKNREKFIFELQNKIVSFHLTKLLSASEDQDSDLKIISAYIPHASLKELEILCDKIKEKPSHIAILATIIDNKAHLFAGMHPGLLKTHSHIHLGKLMRTLCEKLNGKGGGKADFARGSGTDIDTLNGILSMTRTILLY